MFTQSYRINLKDKKRCTLLRLAHAEPCSESRGPTSSTTPASFSRSRNCTRGRVHSMVPSVSGVIPCSMWLS
ncbi:hypothetical protein VTK73DRAFT_7503 [Phialemonium thermophilum]|uniref:Uncharacterized protein n=1 Tax=Phialemonium thermophilum TaxID=223376 RepID=A0ABR3WDY9_9PEZI